MGPEVLKDFETYSPASDVWSLGCVIAFYMRKGKHVFNCNDDVLYYKPEMASDMIFNEESTNNYSSALVQLVCSMIQVYINIQLSPYTHSLIFFYRQSLPSDQLLGGCLQCALLRGVRLAGTEQGGVKERGALFWTGNFFVFSYNGFV